jgi:HAD superfamily hydrolase (TIGR01450 family)
VGRSRPGHRVHHQGRGHALTVELLRPGLEHFRPTTVTIDADGVLHRGSALCPGAVELLGALDARGIPWRIVTNNSRQTPAGAAAHYRHLGLPVEDANVSTAASALAAYIVAHAAGKRRPLVFSLASKELDETLRLAGCRPTRDESRAEWVAIGLDRRLTYRKLQRGCDAVRRGARLVAANLDPTIPNETGAIPGVGAIAAAVQVATGVEPINIGKPSPELMLIAVEEMGGRPAEAIHLGDRLDSDVMGARRAGMVSALVTTGGHSREDAMARPEPERPDAIAPDIPSLMRWLGWVD